MNSIYIPTILVMLILIFLTSMSIMSLIRSTSKNIRDKTLELISVYDEVLEAKSQELQLTRSQIASANAKREEVETNYIKEEKNVEKNSVLAINSSQIIENIEKASYLNEEIPSLYQLIKNHFSHDAKELLKDFPEELKNPKKGKYTKLLEILSYDSVYNLSFLSSEQQIACLLETVEAEYHSLILTYIKSIVQFSSIDFYAYLQKNATMERKPAIIYVSSSSNIKQIEGVQVKINEAICEGIQIEMDHVLYDYAILKKEIGGYVNS